MIRHTYIAQIAKNQALLVRLDSTRTTSIARRANLVAQTR